MEDFALAYQEPEHETPAKGANFRWGNDTDSHKVMTTVCHLDEWEQTTDTVASRAACLVEKKAGCLTVMRHGQIQSTGALGPRVDSVSIDR